MTTELEEVIVARLTGDAGVSAHIGTRLYPGRLPDDPTYPAGVIQRIDSIDLDGMTCSAEMPTARIQLDWYAAGYGTVTKLARAARVALRRWNDGTTEPPVLDVRLASDGDWPADDELGTAARMVYRRSQDWLIDYREAGGA